MDGFRRSIVSIQTAWSGIPVAHRLAAGVLLALSALVAVWGVTSGGRDGWVRIVDREQTVEQRSQVVTQLRGLGIETKVESDSVLVPSARANEAMLHLRSSGTLDDKAFFDYLKEVDLFGTRDKHDRQWLVAVQGRLAAWIQSLKYVRSARVQIAEADPKSLWWHNGRESTAAVILEPEPNETVTASRAGGIAALVAAAIPGLKPSGVKILDCSGRFFHFSEAAAASGGIEEELARASNIELKVARVLPPESRVSAQVRLVSGSESISIAVLIPKTEVPGDEAEREDYIGQIEAAVRAGAGAKGTDAVSVRVAPLSVTEVKGVPAAALPEPSVGMPWPWMALGGLVLAVIFGMYRLSRGKSRVTEEGVVTEESLRAPGESILSAQDEILDRLKDRIRHSVTRNPKEAADVARRWLAP